MNAIVSKNKVNPVKNFLLESKEWITFSEYAKNKPIKKQNRNAIKGYENISPIVVNGAYGLILKFL